MVTSHCRRSKTRQGKTIRNKQDRNKNKDKTEQDKIKDKTRLNETELETREKSYKKTRKFILYMTRQSILFINDCSLIQMDLDSLSLWSSHLELIFNFQ